MNPGEATDATTLAARLGARPGTRGVEFGFWSPRAEGVDVLLFARADDLEAERVVAMVPAHSGLWFAAVEEAGQGTLYGFRARGPSSLGFEPDKLLVDPCARALAPSGRPAREAARRVGSNLATAPKSVVADLSSYDWAGDRAPRTPLDRSLVYEMHVRGFTRHPNSGVESVRAGTFAGLHDRIPHLVRLGVTAVEFLPVQAFDPEDAPEALVNYWGYSPLAWFALHPGYGSSASPLAILDEFRDLVRALHTAGIEVWLDVVFNHTAEGNAEGPTWHLRGAAGQEAYLHGEDGRLFDVTGCGHTVNASQPMMTSMIVECLAHWTAEMHVDGFRFDLGSALTRGVDGTPLEDPPLMQAIERDPRLQEVHLIAEAWDLGGLYQVGRFPGRGWIDWNDRFRDDLRRYLLGEPETLAPLAQRMAGSPDLYGGGPNGVNYITCHDGFTLTDLVSYDRKHNAANGEKGRDGTTHNHSSNHGIEGPTDDPAIEILRLRQVRNALILTLLAPGPALLLMGDELRRTQGGNNNAYAQDSEVSWLDWSLAEEHADLVEFVAVLSALRQDWSDLRSRAEASYPQSIDEERGVALLQEVRGQERLLFALNRGEQEQILELPEGSWITKVASEAGFAAHRQVSGSVTRPPRSVLILQSSSGAATSPST